MGAHCGHLVNTIELSVCGSDAALRYAKLPGPLVIFCLDAKAVYVWPWISDLHWRRRVWERLVPGLDICNKVTSTALLARIFAVSSDLVILLVECEEEQLEKLAAENCFVETSQKNLCQACIIQEQWQCIECIAWTEVRFIATWRSKDRTVCHT